MIIGAQKTGTTSLLRYVAQHPALCTHPHREMSFFSHDLEYCQGYEKVFDKYFPQAGCGNRLMVAKDVMIFPCRKALERVHNHNPTIHIVVLLRHPIRRMYSAYWYARSRGWEPIKSFEKALEAEATRLADDEWKWRYCAYLDTSTYYRHLEASFEQFGRDHVHVYFTEEFYENPQKICEGLFRILDVTPAFAPDVEKRHNRARTARSELFARAFSRFKGSTHPLKMYARLLFPAPMIYQVKHALLALNDKEFQPPPMSEETRKRLVAYFKPYNARLSDLLGRGLPLWDS
jgi:hypothetical protein